MFSALLFSFFGLAANFPFTSQPIPKENCLIETSTKYKTGEVKKDTHAYFQKNKQACEKSRKSHQINFAPQMVDKVESKMVWRGGL